MTLPQVLVRALKSPFYPYRYPYPGDIWWYVVDRMDYPSWSRGTTRHTLGYKIGFVSMRRLRLYVAPLRSSIDYG